MAEPIRATILIPTYDCQVCKHNWIPRVPDPSQCPFCGARYWRKGREGPPNRGGRSKAAR